MKPIGWLFASILLPSLLIQPTVLAADRPNILFILADDVGCDTLGCYGGSSYPTPHIDKLASSGIRFTHCYSMPVCHPSRTTFLTGRYPIHNAHPKWGTFPPQLEQRTLAQLLKSSGYATAVAGKWQLAMLGRDLDHPVRLGFDEYCLFGWHEGPRYHDPLIWQNGKQRTGTSGGYGPDMYVDYLIDFMTRHRDQPFLAFYSMALCHDVTDDLKQPVPYSPGKQRYDNYAEMIAAMDRCVGRVVSALEKLKLSDNTLVIFTGDNGTSKRSLIRAERDNDRWKYIREPVTSLVNGKRVPGGKGNLTNDGTNVPLLCRWPAKVAGGRVVNDLVDFSDFLPTFCELAGVTVPSSFAIDGHSFASRLLTGKRGSRTWAFAEGRGRFWVRTQRWKLYKDGRFFDVANDPLERHNLRKSVPAAGRQPLVKLTQAAAGLSVPGK